MFGPSGPADSLHIAPDDPETDPLVTACRAISACKRPPFRVVALKDHRQILAQYAGAAVLDRELGLPRSFLAECNIYAPARGCEADGVFQEVLQYRFEQGAPGKNCDVMPDVNR